MIQTAIWQDTDFRSLTPDAKLVYLMLLSQAEVGATGRLPMTIKAWCAQTGLTPRRIVASLAALAEGLFIFDDPMEEELIIRSWVAHNVIDSPTMVKAAADQFRHIRSERLKHRLQAEYPTIFDVPVEGVAIPPQGGSERGLAERGKRGERSSTHSIPFSPSDLERENEIDDSALTRLLGVMGKSSDQQAVLELRAFRSRGASEFDFESVRAGVEKARPRYARAYVRKALEKRLAARDTAA